MRLRTIGWLFLVGSSGCATPSGPGADTGDQADSGFPPDSGEGGDSVTSDGELCNGVDDDGDGEVDELGADGCTSGWVDEDGDGYGTSAVCACPGALHVASISGDCDDDLACMTVDCSSEGFAANCALAGVWDYRYAPRAWGDIDGDAVPDTVDGAGNVVRTPAVGLASRADSLVVALSYPWPMDAETVGLGHGLHDYDADGTADYVRVEPSVMAPDDSAAEVHLFVAWFPSVADGVDTAAWIAETPTWTSPIGSTWYHALTQTDVDADGDTDVIVEQAREEGESYVWLADERGGEALVGSNALFGYSGAVRDEDAFQELGDVDGDGLDDLIWGDGLYHGPLAATLLGLADVELSGTVAMLRDGAAVVAADVDGDGLSEVLATNSSGAVEFAELPEISGRWSEQVVGVLSPDSAGAVLFSATESGDLDDDGADEIVLTLYDPTPEGAFVWTGPVVGSHVVSESRVAWPGYGLDIYGLFPSAEQDAVGVWVRDGSSYDSCSFLLLPY